MSVIITEVSDKKTLDEVAKRFKGACWDKKVEKHCVKAVFLCGSGGDRQTLIYKVKGKPCTLI